jgi:hypothetical protein
MTTAYSSLHQLLWYIAINMLTLLHLLMLRRFGTWPPQQLMARMEPSAAAQSPTLAAQQASCALRRSTSLDCPQQYQQLTRRLLQQMLQHQLHQQNLWRTIFKTLLQHPLSSLQQMLRPLQNHPKAEQPLSLHLHLQHQLRRLQLRPTPQLRRILQLTQPQQRL